MAPRIKNISADEFRRMFEAPEIQTPGFSISDAINLSQALETKKKNELEQRRQVAEIERKIAEQEAIARQQEQLAQPEVDPFQQKIAEIEQNLAMAEQMPTGELVAGETAQVPGLGEVATPREELLKETEVGQQLRSDVDATIAPLQAQIDTLRAEAKLDPKGFLKRRADKEAAALEFERDKELLGLKFANDLKKMQQKEETKEKKAVGKASALVQRLAAQSKNLRSMVDEFEKFETMLSKEGFTGVKGVAKGKIAVPLDKLTGGAAQLLAGKTFMGDFLRVNPEISTQDELADSLARRIYKTISGDVGNIAFSEGAFAKAFVPRAGEVPSRRKAKIARLERFIKAMDTGASELRRRFNSGDITAEEVELELGDIANSAFAEQVQTEGIDATVSQAEAAGGLTPEEQLELEQLRQEFGGQ